MQLSCLLFVLIGQHYCLLRACRMALGQARIPVQVGRYSSPALLGIVNVIDFLLPIFSVVDIAGSGGVHLVGGASAFVGAYMLGPRLGRWDLDGAPPMGKPVDALIGLFMLWWGWLAFNSGR